MRKLYVWLFAAVFAVVTAAAGHSVHPTGHAVAGGPVGAFNMPVEGS